MNRQMLKTGKIFTLIFSFSLITLIGCGEDAKEPDTKDEDVQVWQGDDPAPTKKEEGDTTGTQEPTKSADPTTGGVESGDGKITFKEDKGSLYAQISTDLPVGTMVQVNVAGPNNYRFETRYKVDKQSTEIGPMTKDGKPLSKGVYELTWAPLPIQAQTQGIRSELRQKNITGGKKSVTLPM